MHLVFLTPSPDPAGGGRAFNAGLIPALRAAGHQIDVRHTADDLPQGARPVVDGLLLPALEPQLDTLLAHDAVAIIHHLGAAAGRDPALRETVRATERRMLPAFRRVLTTSEPVATRLRDQFGIEATLCTPGLPDLPRTLQASAPPCRILCAGVLTPRKGQDRLLEALARLADLDWTLTIAGDAERDTVYAATLAPLAERLGIASRVHFIPNPDLDTLGTAWRATDLFALTSSWEGWPAAVAEALRRGIPVLATSVPSLSALVPQAAGVLAPPDDPVTLSKCVRRVIFDADLRRNLAEGAWQTGLALPGWPPASPRLRRSSPELTQMPLLGCIADDFTGATDLAGTLVAGGMRTIQLIGVPAADDPVPDADAIVVALKSRTIPAQDAVRQSLASLAWLQKAGCRQILFKYCSTFDSTDDGNIGPVADALIQALGCGFAIACPAFPTNGAPSTWAISS